MLIKANAIQMHYELSGKNGAPVVMLSHSLGSSLVMWEPQLSSLNAHFQVLRYDTRGHGKSEVTAGPYTLEVLANDAVALLDGLGISAVHFVGLSMGGMVGQSLALRYARRLKSLVLCDTTALIPSEAQPQWQERIDAVRRQGMEAVVETTMERWFSPSYLESNSPMVATIRRQFLATPVDGYIACSEAIRKLLYLERLREVTIPTLIMVGADDPGTPVAASQAMHERIGHSRLVILPSARHFSSVEQADAFNDVLSRFLRDPKSHLPNEAH